MKEVAAKQVAEIIIKALKNHDDDSFLKELKLEVRKICEHYPLP
jgi:glycine/serine hydroxymethyltransferase